MAGLKELQSAKWKVLHTLPEGASECQSRRNAKPDLKELQSAQQETVAYLA
jgi:hypothetical protein